jgi:hypothetical protein
MIIQSNKVQEGLQNIIDRGDKRIFQHLENVTPMMKTAQEMREHSNNGWTEKKSMRHIASLPNMIVLKYPELLQDQTGALLRKFLQTEEGMRYACVSPSTI